ncbi:MAG: methionyl-tRNA formyltransferase [Saprospiraceae bacterium]
MNNLSDKQKVYVLIGCKSWHKRLFKEQDSENLDSWYFIKSLEELTTTHINNIHPRRIFFLHWSWKVPDEIIENYECICFHMTDVPYGRGGSPLQNLIVRGHQITKLTALRMTNEFDAGPIYLQEDLSLGGGAEEIYLRATKLSFKMIENIIRDDIKPVPQIGEPTLFKRRKPEESKIEQINSLDKLHDFIRMLDAEGYPKAFLEYEGFRYEFSRSALYDGRIIADVKITPLENEQNGNDSSDSSSS